ncbi:Hypothetical protein PBC10988_4700 [Planctomycetales bacterium 10988]|nr:Hypothetical protein PBC10988_4700 [Planctomycetales bacterium 10988]
MTTFVKQIEKNLLDRSEVALTVTQDSIHHWVTQYLNGKRTKVQAGELSAGRYDPIRCHLQSFEKWFGKGASIKGISGKVLSDFHRGLLDQINSQRSSQDYAKDRMNTLKNFVHWLENNLALNVANGDLFRWDWMWEQIADFFGLEVAEYPGQETPLVEQMRDAGPIWDEIVQKHDLRKFTSDELAPWWHTDADLTRTFESFADLSRSRELGFHAFIKEQVLILQRF